MANAQRVADLTEDCEPAQYQTLNREFIPAPCQPGLVFETKLKEFKTTLPTLKVGVYSKVIRLPTKHYRIIPGEQVDEQSLSGLYVVVLAPEVYKSLGHEKSIVVTQKDGWCQHEIINMITARYFIYSP